MYSNSSVPFYIEKVCPKSVSVDAKSMIRKFKSSIKQSQSYIRQIAFQSLCVEGVYTAE